jgi:hypothetical protein
VAFSRSDPRNDSAPHLDGARRKRRASYGQVVAFEAGETLLSIKKRTRGNGF